MTSIMQKSPTARYWEVDLMRGVAVALMILYHLIFDLEYFAVLKIDASKGPALWLAREIGRAHV